MNAASAAASSFANSGGARTCTTSTAIGSANSAIVNKIRQIYASKTAATLAVWLKISMRTAKHRLAGEREFTLDEIEKLLHSEHGYRILTALMERAPRKPSWWATCEPLMDLADAERMTLLARQRVAKAIEKQDNAFEELEIEIGRAETLAIHGSGPARAHADALQSIARNSRGVVAKARRK